MITIKGLKGKWKIVGIAEGIVYFRNKQGKKIHIKDTISKDLNDALIEYTGYTLKDIEKIYDKKREIIRKKIEKAGGIEYVLKNNIKINI